MALARVSRIGIVGALAASAMTVACGVDHRDGWFSCQPGHPETCWSGAYCHSDRLCYSYPEEEADVRDVRDDARRDADAEAEAEAVPDVDDVPDTDEGAEAGEEADGDEGADADDDVEDGEESDTDVPADTGDDADAPDSEAAADVEPDSAD